MSSILITAQIHAQDFVPQIHADTSLGSKTVSFGTEVPGKGYCFVGYARGKTDSSYSYLLFSTDYSGNLIHKRLIPYSSTYDHFVQYRNIHYTGSGYILIGFTYVYQYDSINQLNEGPYIVVTKLDDQFNLQTHSFTVGSGTDNMNEALKSRFINNRIIICGPFYSGTYFIAVDTAGAIQTYIYDHDSTVSNEYNQPAYDIVKSDSGYIGVLGSLTSRSYIYLTDSLKRKGFSAPLDYQFCASYPAPAGCAFRNTALDQRWGGPANITLKRVSVGSLVQGSQCDSSFYPFTDPAQAKTMYCLVKTDNEGNVRTKKGFTPDGWSNFFQERNVINTFDFVDPNNIYIGVNAGGSFFVVNVDSNLNERWRRMIHHPDPNMSITICYGVLATSDGGCIVMGRMRDVTAPDPSYAPIDAYIVKLNANGLQTGTPELAEKSDHITIYPNPFSDHIIVSSDVQKGDNLEVVDISGRRIQQQILSGSEERIHLNVVPGMYFYSIKRGSQILKTGKLIRQ